MSFCFFFWFFFSFFFLEKSHAIHIQREASSLNIDDCHNLGDTFIKSLKQQMILASVRNFKAGTGNVAEIKHF